MFESTFSHKATQPNTINYGCVTTRSLHKRLSLSGYSFVMVRVSIGSCVYFTNESNRVRKPVTASCLTAILTGSIKLAYEMNPFSHDTLQFFSNACAFCGEVYLHLGNAEVFIQTIKTCKWREAPLEWRLGYTVGLGRVGINPMCLGRHDSFHWWGAW